MLLLLLLLMMMMMWLIDVVHDAARQFRLDSDARQLIILHQRCFDMPIFSSSVTRLAMSRFIRKTSLKRLIVTTNDEMKNNDPRQKARRSTEKEGKGSGFIQRFYCSTSHSRRSGTYITQFYLQITPYLPLPRKRSPDGASQTEVAYI